MACLFQHFGSFSLLGREGRDDTSVHESAERLHVVWIPLRVHSSVRPFLEVEHGGLNIWFFAFTYFSLAVEVPDGFGQGLGNIWAFFLEGIPDVMGGGDIGLTPLEGSGNAEQSYDV